MIGMVNFGRQKRLLLPVDFAYMVFYIRKETV